MLINWAQTYTVQFANVSARQQTTMSSMGTLAHYLYTNGDLVESTIPYSANLLLY